MMSQYVKALDNKLHYSTYHKDSYSWWPQYANGSDCNLHYNGSCSRWANIWKLQIVNCSTPHTRRAPAHDEPICEMMYCDFPLNIRPSHPLWAHNEQHVGVWAFHCDILLNIRASGSLADRRLTRKERVEALWSFTIKQQEIYIIDTCLVAPWRIILYIYYIYILYILYIFYIFYIFFIFYNIYYIENIEYRKYMEYILYILYNPYIIYIIYNIYYNNIENIYFICFI